MYWEKKKKTTQYTFDIPIPRYMPFPGHNANVERIFSPIVGPVDQRTRSSLQELETQESIVEWKFNFEMTRSECRTYVMVGKTRDTSDKRVKKSAKYNISTNLI